MPSSPHPMSIEISHNSIIQAPEFALNFVWFARTAECPRRSIPGWPLLIDHHHSAPRTPSASLLQTSLPIVVSVSLAAYSVYSFCGDQEQNVNYRSSSFNAWFQGITIPELSGCSPIANFRRECNLILQPESAQAQSVKMSWHGTSIQSRLFIFPSFLPWNHSYV